MAETETPEMLYFSSVQGRVVARFGTGAFIGCKKEVKRNKQGAITGRKWVWDTDRVVAIPKIEAVGNLKSYMGAVRRKDLVARTAADHEKWLEKQKEQGEKDAKVSKKRGKGKRTPAQTPGTLDGGAPAGAGGEGAPASS